MPKSKRQMTMPITSLLQAGSSNIKLTAFQPTGHNTAIFGVTSGNQTAGFIEVELAPNGTVTIIKAFQPVPMLPDSQYSKHPEFALHSKTGNSVRTWHEALASGQLVVRAQTVDKNGNQLGICTTTNGSQDEIEHTVAINNDSFAICAVEGNDHHRVDFHNLDCTRLPVPENPWSPTYNPTLIGANLGVGGFFNTLTLTDNRILTVLTKYKQSNGLRVYIERRDLKDWDTPLIPSQKIVDNMRTRTAPSCALTLNDGVTCANKLDVPSNDNDNVEIHTVGVDNTVTHPGIANGGIKLGSFPITKVYACLFDNCSLVFFINKNTGGSHVTKVILNEKGHAINIESPVSFQTTASNHAIGHAFGVFPNGDAIDISIDNSGNLRAAVIKNMTTPAPYWPLGLGETSVKQSTSQAGTTVVAPPITTLDVVAPTQGNSPSVDVTTRPLAATLPAASTEGILSRLNSPGTTLVPDLSMTNSTGMRWTVGGSLMMRAISSVGMSSSVLTGILVGVGVVVFLCLVVLGIGFHRSRQSTGSNNKDVELGKMDYIINGTEGALTVNIPVDMETVPVPHTPIVTRTSQYQNAAEVKASVPNGVGNAQQLPWVYEAVGDKLGNGPTSSQNGGYETVPAENGVAYTALP